ncbi:restriction endonuclease subunit S [Aquirufa aurantiipilula]|uniref:restriction endonuclease subunit S n=1 Tax=Aquirufa aurantiipilula TaxID=2696561 RepID=UPI001CAA4C62|nr:restriction endonuclease subunit S [Aquirufa aurantiipilula]MBZ1326544.1 hypothetical protein [Aquirufa aurantiipilula]
MIEESLPDGWELVHFGDVIDIISGKNQKNVESNKGQYPIYGSGGVMSKADQYLCEAGTTIIGRKGTINSPIYVNERFWNVDTAFGLSPFGVHKKLFYYYCLFYNFKKLDKSTTIPSLAKSDLLQIEFLLPPLAEQHRIVAKIEELFSELDKGVDLLKTAQQQLKVYRQSVLKYAFEGRLTNPDLPEGELPEGWGKKSVESVCELLNGFAFKSSDFLTSGIKVVKISNIGYSQFLYKDQQYLPESFLLAHSKYIINSGDLLFALTRPITNNTTKICFYPNNDLSGLLNQRVACFKDITCLPKYIFYFCMTEEFKKAIKAKFTETLQPNLSPNDLKKVLIPIPESLKLQAEVINEIEFRLSVCDKIEESLEEGLQQAEALRQSILKKAFEGKLVPQDPNDEPASVLLEKIKADRAALQPAKTTKKVK